MSALLGQLRSEFALLRARIEQAEHHQKASLLAEAWKLEDAIKRELSRQNRRRYQTPKHYSQVLGIDD